MIAFVDCLAQLNVIYSWPQCCCVSGLTAPPPVPNEPLVTVYKVCARLFFIWIQLFCFVQRYPVVMSTYLGIMGRILLQNSSFFSSLLTQMASECGQEVRIGACPSFLSPQQSLSTPVKDNASKVPVKSESFRNWAQSDEPWNCKWFHLQALSQSPSPLLFWNFEIVFAPTKGKWITYCL